MEAITTTLLCGLIISHVGLWYKIGKIEERLKNLEEHILNSEKNAKSMV
jgi:hypothetical protein